jgi:fumarylacetoacetate (FAA) hydrolase family protein
MGIPSPECPMLIFSSIAQVSISSDTSQVSREQGLKIIEHGLYSSYLYILVKPSAMNFTKIRLALSLSPLPGMHGPLFW